MIKLTSPIAVLILAYFAMLGPVATAIYLPAFPAMTASFGVEPEQIQLTLTTYMIGLAVSQLFYGPLSDRVGRRPVLITGFILFVVSSLACMAAENISTFIALRFFQAFGAGAGVVLTRAIVRDVFSPASGAWALAHIGSAVSTAPALAPILGGFLVVSFNWPSIFLAMTLTGSLAIVLVVSLLPESLDKKHRQQFEIQTVLKNYRQVLCNRSYMGYTLCASLMFAGHYAFITTSSFILIDLYEVATESFGYYYIVIIGAFIVGNQIGVRLAARLSAQQVIMIGSMLITAGGAVMLLLLSAHLAHPMVIIGPYLFSAFGAGLMLPHCINGAFSGFPHIAGSASAMFGFMQMISGAASSALLGFLYNGTALPTAIVITILGILTSIIFYFLVSKAPSKSTLENY